MQRRIHMYITYIYILFNVYIYRHIYYIYVYCIYIYICIYVDTWPYPKLEIHRIFSLVNPPFPRPVHPKVIGLLNFTWTCRNRPVTSYYFGVIHHLSSLFGILWRHCYTVPVFSLRKECVSDHLLIFVGPKGNPKTWMPHIDYSKPLMLWLGI